MRGKVVTVDRNQIALGITPAYAGKRILSSTARISRRDHPRVCGEKTNCDRLSQCSTGSPPRMRGKARAAPCQLFEVWITPAYAGKSHKKEKARVRSGSWDHPRICGEKYRRCVSGKGCKGSPPHMRGKAFLWLICANTTGDHPRTCGEKLYAMKPARAGKGSPPHMRGKD